MISPRIMGIKSTHFTFQLSCGLVFGLPRASFLPYFALAWHFLFRLLTSWACFFPLGLAIFSPDDIDHQPIFPCWGCYRCLKLLINEYGKKLIHWSGWWFQTFLFGKNETYSYIIYNILLFGCVILPPIRYERTVMFQPKFDFCLCLFTANHVLFLGVHRACKHEWLVGPTVNGK